MPVATRLLVAFLLLIAAFVVLVGVAVYSLLAAGQGTLAGVVAMAGLLGLAAGAFTYWLLRRDVAGEWEELLPEPPMPREQPIVHASIRRAPLRVQTMPVANLPPAYVDAVLRGAQARLSAMKARQPHAAETR